MEVDYKTQKAIAERIRLAVKELRWAALNLAAIYEAIRTEENLPLEDPNQLKLFDESNDALNK